MRLLLFLVAIIAFVFQGCTMMPGSFGGWGNNYSANQSFTNTPSYSTANTVTSVELERVTGNDLNILERVVFVKELKRQMAQRGKVVIVDDSPMLKLTVVINRNLIYSKKYRTVAHGMRVYHLDRKYETQTQYYIEDGIHNIPLKGTINYNVTVKAKSGFAYDDAERVAIKRLLEAIAKKVADAIESKSSVLSQKYN